MKKIFALVIIAFAFAACGGPAETDVEAAIDSTIVTTDTCAGLEVAPVDTVKVDSAKVESAKK